MTKSFSEFICQNCGAKSAAFLGRCPNCGAWGSYVETPKEQEKEVLQAEKVQLLSLSQISKKPTKRISTGISEIDRVLGGGIVPASVILIAGEPGIGKSTLLTQLGVKIASNGKKVIYFTGEESADQVLLRADRVAKHHPKSFFLATETDVEKIVATAISEKPDLAICDSIQTTTWRVLSGTAGSVGQVRECARILHQTAKSCGFPLILVGHVTKEGVVAGPKVLEHLVDVVLEFSGDTQHNFRILRSTKNRYGAISEVGVFEMGEVGLSEVSTPSKYFLSQKVKNATGSIVFPTVTGGRTMLVEIQALTVKTTHSLPKRVVNGLDYLRVAQVLAVLGKNFKIPVYDFDIYVGVAGGLKITETAADLPTTLSILSVFWGKPLNGIAAAAEVGLLGELRNVPSLESRKKEAAKFGFSKFFGPQFENITKCAKIVFGKN